MNHPLDKLSALFAQELSRWGGLDDKREEQLYSFKNVSKRTEMLAKQFSEGGYMPPPQEKRREALRKFKLADLPLTKAEWRLIFAGLSDDDQQEPPVLENDGLFARVREEVKAKINSGILNRRDWLSLCASYFSYTKKAPQENVNWMALRDDLNIGFDSIKARQKHEKEWIKIVSDYRDLFGDAAGERLGHSMFNGDMGDLSRLQKIAQISQNSWLWQRIFNAMIARLFQIEDSDFLGRLDSLIDLAEQYPYYCNQLLAAVLTRYKRSQFHDTPHARTKQVSLEKWGSPQLHSNKYSWQEHVQDEVCAMVIRWVAKEDLEHFFRLLQGNSGVDDARLKYWLRFVGQITYTRIVMGSDAFHSRARDFANFREKNRSRISELVGQSNNNAFIMQIGDYFFVEFSEKGNACYVYIKTKIPFGENKQSLTVHHLKSKARAVEYITHHVNWQLNADRKLEALGIKPDDSVTGEMNRLKSAGGIKIGADPGGVKGGFAKSESRALQDIESVIIEAKEMLRFVEHFVVDNRKKGGTFWIHLSRQNPKVKKELIQLGFRASNESENLKFWIQ